MSNQKKKPLSFGETQQLSNDQHINYNNTLTKQSQFKDHNVSRLFISNEELAESPSNIELIWQSPELVRLKYETRTDFPLENLPLIFYCAVKEVIDYTKAPLAVAASSALAIASLATQGLADVQRDNTLSGPVCMFFLTIGDSGERKTSCDKLFNRAVRELQTEQNISRNAKISEFNTLMESWTAKKNRLLSNSNDKKGDNTLSEDEKKKILLEFDSQKPVMEKTPNFFLCDETPESLTWRLNAEWPSQAIISSESGIIFGAASMRKDSIARTLGIYNTIWDDATSYSVGRKWGQSYYLEKARLTLAFQIQPAVFELFMEQTGGIARGSGFLSRFLITKPLSTQGTRFYNEAPINWPGLDEFNNRTKELLKMPLSWENGIISPKMISLDIHAREIWIKFHDATEVELKNCGKFFKIRDIASKAAENAARLAAIFHVFSHGPTGTVSADSMHKAVEIVKWYLNEAVLLFTNQIDRQEHTDSEKLLEKLINICRTNNAIAMQKTHIYQYSHLRSAKELYPVLDNLINANCIKTFSFQNYTYVAVNPELI